MRSMFPWLIFAQILFVYHFYQNKDGRKKSRTLVDSFLRKSHFNKSLCNFPMGQIDIEKYDGAHEIKIAQNGRFLAWKVKIFGKYFKICESKPICPWKLSIKLTDLIFQKWDKIVSARAISRLLTLWKNEQSKSASNHQLRH